MDVGRKIVRGLMMFTLYSFYLTRRLEDLNEIEKL